MMKKLAALLTALMLLSGAQAQNAYVVQASNMVALVDADGAVLIQDQSADALFALRKDALYAVGSAGEYALYGIRGNRLTDDYYEMLEAVGDVVLFRQNGKYGAMDLNGTVLVSPEWAQLTYAEEGAFLALDGDLYDDQPDEMISVTADGERQSTGSLTANGLRAFYDGRMAFMLSDGQYGHVDAQGRQVIPPQWRYAGDFSDGVAVVSDGGGMGLIDAEGKTVAAPEYDWIQRGQGIIAAHTSDGRVDVLSPDGTENLFTIALPDCEAEVCGGYTVLRNDDGTRLYDRNGDRVCALSRSALLYPGLNDQVIVADGAWGEACQYLLNPDGTAASEAYQRILPLCGERYAFVRFQEARNLDDDMDGTRIAWDYDSARYGLLAADGRELLPAQYREILPAGSDRLVLVSEEAVIFSDPDGNAIREWPVTETAASSFEADA